MKHKGSKSIDKAIKSSTKLLESIVSEIIQNSIKIYACYPPGELIGDLFEFKSDDFFINFKQNFISLKQIFIDNIERLPYNKTTEVTILANIFAQIGDFDTAKKIYENLVLYNQNNAQAWSNLLTFYMREDRLIDALECYLHIPPEFIKMANKEKSNSEYDSYRLLNISAYYGNKNNILNLTFKDETNPQLKTEFENELRKLSAFTEFAKGQEALANNSVDEALVHFSSLTEKMPDSDVLWYFMGKTAYDGHHFVIAEEYLKRAIKLKNVNTEYWISLADCFFAQHKNEQGIKALKTALTLDPKNVQCWELAGRMINIIENLGEYNQFLYKLQVMPNLRVYQRFAEALIEKKNYRKAMEILQQAIKKFPEDEVLLENLAKVYERMLRFDDAITIYERLITKGINIQKYLRKITSILTVLHDDKRLVRILKMLSSYLPLNDANLWDKIGNILLKAKDYLGASEAFRKVIAINTNDPKVLFNLALTYQELALYKKAEETYRKVIELNPKDHAALNNLANVLKELKKYDEAIDIYKRAIEIEPNKAISFANLGILYEELKLKNEAKDCYRKAKEIALKNKDYKSAAKFEEWENSVK